jgi:bacterioferritin
VEGRGLIELAKEQRVAERIALDSYRETIACPGTEDAATRRTLEGILAME